jgi:hypothetical protein
VTHWTAVYSDEQRSAIEHAFCEVRIRPVARIVRMAAAGELRESDGADFLAPFDIPYSSAVYIGKSAERRKAGKMRAEIARQSPRDRAQDLQDRLTGAIDFELERIERLQRGHRPVNGDQLRKLGRALRELAMIPDPSERRLPRELGQATRDGRKPDAATRDNLAGAILAASDASVSPSVRARTKSTHIDERNGERARGLEHHEEAREIGSDAGPCQQERA